jgi:hypothetical protein
VLLGKKTEMQVVRLYDGNNAARRPPRTSTATVLLVICSLALLGLKQLAAKLDCDDMLQHRDVQRSDREGREETRDGDRRFNVRRHHGISPLTSPLSLCQHVCPHLHPQLHASLFSDTLVLHSLCSLHFSSKFPVKKRISICNSFNKSQSCNTSQLIEFYI